MPKPAHVLVFLNRMLQCARKNNRRPAPWNEGSYSSFDLWKQALAEATLLTHRATGVPLRLTADTSYKAMGGKLEQLNDDS